MAIYFGEALKKLRTEKNITQEVLAGYLGVSSQAISKWERNENYPDITLLPPLACYFDVDIEVLLGMDKNKDDKQIEKIFEAYKQNISSGNVESSIEILKKGIKQFPDNFELLTELMCTLYIRKENDEEIADIGERILANCVNEKLRIKAKNILFKVMLEKGEKDKARAIIGTLPHVRDTKEWAEVLWSDTLYPPETRVMSSKQNIALWTYDLSSFMTRTIKSIDNLCSPAQEAVDNNDIGSAIDCYKTIIKLYNLIYPNGDYGFYNMELCYITGRIGVHYSQLGDTDNLLIYLQECIEFAKAFDMLPDVFVYTSPLVKGLVYDMGNIQKSSDETMCEKARRYYFLNGLVPEKLKSNLKWQEMLDSLNEYILSKSKKPANPM